MLLSHAEKAWSHAWCQFIFASLELVEDADGEPDWTECLAGGTFLVTLSGSSSVPRTQCPLSLR